MASPSPERIKQQEFYGTVVSKTNFTNSSLSFMSVGISWFMVIYGLSTFLETPKERRKGRAKFLFISFAICVLLSADVARGAWGTYERLYSSAPDGRDYLRQYIRVTNINWYRRLETILVDAYIAIGDWVMLYRAFVIWRHRRWVLILPTLTISAHAILAILSPIEIPSLHVSETSLAVILLNVSTNIMITALIVSRLVQTRRNIAKAMPTARDRSDPGRMDYSDVMAILIESAAPLAVFGILCAISQVVSIYANQTLYERARWEGCRSAFAFLYYSFCALSPQMVIFRVTTGRSWNHAREAEDGSAAFSRPIEFGRVTSEDSESFNDAEVGERKQGEV